ncbi:MAG: flagellar hook-associated protein FlgL [Gammaproteobacteria bacterium]|nr:flagellar hook-associated protein FlgL [Gammaproteobacteria bacterium]
MRVSTPLVFKNSLDGMLQQQALLNRTQSQISSGQKMLAPADDPYGASRILDLSAGILTNDQFSENADYAVNRLALSDSTLASVGDYIQRVRELTVQANNGTQTIESLRDISAEIQLLLDGMVSLGNTRDSNGEYVFSGNQGKTIPFAATSAGNFAYFGDQGQRQVRIGGSTMIAVSDSGDDVFRMVRRGNGTFETAEAVTNVGTGMIDIGSVAGTYTPGYYEIKFMQPPQPALYTDLPQYYVLYQPITTPPAVPPAQTVIVSGSGATYATEAAFLAAVLAGTENGVSYKEGSTISFNGIQTSIVGTPDPGSRTAPPGPTITVGDSFTLNPSTHQDIFQTVQNLVNALTMPHNTDANKAHFHNAINRVIADLDQGLGNIVDYRAKIGGRLNIVDRQKGILDAVNIQSKTTISQIKDLDYAEAATNLSRQLLGLEAAQSAFAKTQALSLFNYIR